MLEIYTHLLSSANSGLPYGPRSAAAEIWLWKLPQTVLLSESTAIDIDNHHTFRNACCVDV